MEQINTMKLTELMEKLKKVPLFGINDLSKITGLKSATTRMLAWRLAKKGLITRIERAKYTTQDEPLTVAAYLVPLSFIGLYSALRFHGMTTQVLAGIDILTKKSRKPATVLGRRVSFTKTKHFWGFEKYKIGGFEVLVSDPEKTIIDCLLSEKIGPDVVFEALAAKEIDEMKLLSYARKINSSALGKRLGFLLGKSGRENYDYRIYARGPYVLLDARVKKKGRKNREWRIVENVVIK